MLTANNAFELVEFSEENLLKWLCYGSDILKVTRNINYHILDENGLRKKNIYSVLLDYLQKDNECLKARHILIEKNYYSHSYVSDYKNFYVSYYNTFPRNTIRLHFFEEYEGFSNINGLKDLLHHLSIIENDKYIGYIVVKPVPFATIGATVLKTYKNDCENNSDLVRNYLALKTYDASVFGRKFTIKSMIFAEQDKAVGACATFALWAGLHIMCHKFNLQIRTPSEITILAGIDNNLTTRLFPNNGLTTMQISNAIQKVGFEPYVVKLTDSTSKKNNLYFLKSFIYAYLKCNIPIFAEIKFPDDSIHLITINGFRNKKKSCGMDKISSMDLFYAHDDQIGPFSKYILLDAESSNDEKGVKVRSPWKKNNDNN